MVQKKASDASERKVLADIKKEGWCCIDIEGGESSPPYAFTVGLEHTFKHPELTIFGLSTEVAHAILAGAVHSIRSGGRFQDGQKARGLIHAFPTPIVESPKASYGTYFGFATWFYEGIGYRMLQIAWPDKAGTYPWQPGVNPHIKASQPVLGKDPYWTAFDEGMRAEFDKLGDRISESLGSKIAAGDFETLSKGDDGSRTIRLNVEVSERMVRVTATIFDDKQGLIRIEEVVEA